MPFCLYSWAIQLPRHQWTKAATILFYCVQNMCTAGPVHCRWTTRAFGSIIVISTLFMIISVSAAFKSDLFSWRRFVFVRLQVIYVFTPRLKQKLKYPKMINLFWSFSHVLLLPELAFSKKNRKTDQYSWVFLLWRLASSFLFFSQLNFARIDCNYLEEIAPKCWSCLNLAISLSWCLVKNNHSNVRSVSV